MKPLPTLRLVSSGVISSNCILVIIEEWKVLREILGPQFLCDNLERMKELFHNSPLTASLAGEVRFWGPYRMCKQLNGHTRWTADSTRAFVLKGFRISVIRVVMHCKKLQVLTALVTQASFVWIQFWALVLCRLLLCLILVCRLMVKMGRFPVPE